MIYIVKKKKSRYILLFIWCALCRKYRCLAFWVEQHNGRAIVKITPSGFHAHGALDRFRDDTAERPRCIFTIINSLNLAIIYYKTDGLRYIVHSEYTLFPRSNTLVVDRLFILFSHYVTE